MIFRALFFEHDAEIRQKGHLWTGTSYPIIVVSYRMTTNIQLTIVRQSTKGSWQITSKIIITSQTDN